MSRVSRGCWPAIQTFSWPSRTGAQPWEGIPTNDRSSERGSAPMSPFQGSGDDRDIETQGCALGYSVPFQGDKKVAHTGQPLHRSSC